MALPVVWVIQLSDASLDLSHSDLIRYKRKSVGAHQVQLQTCVLLLRRAYAWYVCACVCVYASVISGSSSIQGIYGYSP